MDMVRTSETELEELRRQWAAAELHGDPSRLDQLLADDFTGVGPRGFVLTKQQWLQRYQSGDLKNQSFRMEEVGLRTYGDAAVATGRQTTKSTYQGHDSGGQFRTTQIFVRQDGGWLLAGIHLSSLTVHD
jgi:ketosteroid isomerase-like protein